MLWIKIPAELERQLRSERSNKDKIAKKLVAIIDMERKKLAERPGKVTWGWIIKEFRKHLGRALALPPTPSSRYIADQVTRVKRLGLDEQQIQYICEALVRQRRESGEWVYYDLEWILGRAGAILSGGYRPGAEKVRVVHGRDSEYLAGGERENADSVSADILHGRVDTD